MANREGDPPAWPSPVSHPVVVNTRHDTTGKLSLEAASPHAMGSSRELFSSALRRDVGVFTVERARSVFREVPRSGATIAPEICKPFVDANAFGVYLKNVLPIVLVQNRRGELLPEARVALKYLRENESRYASVLERIARHAPAIFEPERYAELRARHPLLFSDVVQPYATLSPQHMIMGTGCYARTPRGVATMLGAPTNQPAPLAVRTGLMETEWFHSQFVIVFESPQPSEPVVIIDPGTVIAQLFFVTLEAADGVELRFSPDDLAADPSYRARSIQAGLELVRSGRELVVSETTGVKSVSLSCPHCWVSVSAAADGELPEDHVERQDFYRGYKTIRAEYHRANCPHEPGERSE